MTDLPDARATFDVVVTEDCQLVPRDPAEWHKWLKSHQGLIQVVLFRQRSGPQNRKYFAVVKYFSERTGYDHKEAHQLFKDRFNAGRSTADLSVEEFSRYIDEIERWLAEEGL
jgi:hypothetical protein